MGVFPLNEGLGGALVPLLSVILWTPPYIRVLLDSDSTLLQSLSMQ